MVKMSPKGKFILYNETYFVENKAESEWLKYFLEIYIPILKTNPKFLRTTFSRVLNQFEEDHISYAIQLYLNQNDELEINSNKEILEAKMEMKNRFGERYLIHATLMKVLEDYSN